MANKVMEDEAEMDQTYSAPEPAEKSAEKQTMDEEEQNPSTSLVSLQVLTGKDGVPPKKGEERVVRVVEVYGDEAEIEYAPEKPGGGEGDEMSADEEIDKMDNPGMTAY